MKERLLLTFLVLCLVSIGVIAQQTATIKSFTVTTDHIPVADRRMDLNGTPCALVKIQVLDDIERIEGNKIGDIIYRGVEKWVYMCKGSRNMRIHFKNHLPAKVNFLDYQINGLESNRVYELTVETENKADAAIDNKVQTFILNYSPSTATILIDSKLYKGNGRVEAVLPVGEHNYTIAADGYATTEGAVKLNENVRREITETLIPENSSLYNSQEKDINNSFGNQLENGYNQTVPYQNSTFWNKTNYSKSMIRGEGAFLFKGLYYIVISHEKKTVAVVKPKKVKYTERTYVIPAQVQYGGIMYTVTEIAPSAFFKSKNLKDIVLPETIEAIGATAFAFCGELDHFAFPPNLRYIGEEVFVFDEITEIVLPKSIEEIADNAFLKCNKRKLSGHPKMGRLFVPNTVKKIGKNAFAGSIGGFGKRWTAKFDIQNLPEWVTPTIAKEIGIHEDSFEEYVKQSSK